VPGFGSIYHLWKALDIHLNVGGACSEIIAPKTNTPPVQLHINPAFIDLVLDNAVAAQNFEYRLSNILDKPLYILLQLLLARPPLQFEGSVFDWVILVVYMGNECDVNVTGLRFSYGALIDLGNWC